MSTCYFDGCDRAGRSAGSAICTTHASRLKAAGIPIRTPRPCEWCGDSFLGQKGARRCFTCRANPPACTVPGCHRPRKHFQFCGAHYCQKWRGEDMRLTGRGMGAEDRLLAKRRLSPGGCWEWTGHVDTPGYGVTSISGKTWRVHRLAYSTWVGPIPDGEQIHHACSNRRCFNPDHLQAATQRENVGEMLARLSYERRIAALETRVAELEAELASRVPRVRSDCLLKGN